MAAACFNEERRRRRALLSWRLDLISCTAILALLCCWLSDIKRNNQHLNTDNSPLLSKSFLENGFCLSPKFDNTHFSCASFDFVCACVCILAILFGTINPNNNGTKTKNKSKILPGSAIYFLAHSFGHYKFSLNDGNVTLQSASENDTSERIQSLIILAFILSVGPLEAASILIKSKRLTPKYAYSVAGIMLAALVGIYHFYISHPSYALLYINISIILSISLPKLLFVGYTSDADVMLRFKDIRTRAKVISGMVVMIVIICEPFFCDWFFAKIGGHFLFDLSLALDAVVVVMMEWNKEGDCVVDNDDDEVELRKLKGA